MAYNEVADILAAGRLTLTDSSQSEIELSIDEATDEIDLRIPPLSDGDEGYDRYERRLPMKTRAHAYLTLAYLFGRLAYDTLTNAEPGDPFGVVDMQFGAKTPETNTIAQFYRSMQKDYRSHAERLIKQASYRIPRVRRPQALDLTL